ncbi:2-oxoglutarate and iron-dependent oxygenase domain-containing protein [Gluconacetobacter sp. Hr-1-5]|uniref:2-oxoglutarate and iron-dependent oxygenase domain-containing protein n=1 Tax=Gluconacetobacter sp. Hr-1-5 TaxID=3395370 RepID=UPI003B529472
MSIRPALLGYGGNFSFGRTAYPRGGEFRVTGRPYACLLLLEAGMMRTVIDRQERTLHAGECGLFINRTGRCAHYAPRSTVLWCETPLSVAPPPEAANDSLGQRVQASVRLKTLFREGLACGTLSSPATDILRNALGEALLAAWRIEAGLDIAGHLPAPLLAARDYIARHYAEKPALNRLAAIANVTPAHLIALFRRHLGTTPMRHLREVRAQAAARLIRHTDMTLADIAELTGYGTGFHLSREVRLLVGLSPRLLRRRGIREPGSFENGDGVRIQSDAPAGSAAPLPMKGSRPMSPLIPVIDIAPLRNGDDASRTDAAAAIGKACRETGFFYITGHGVALETVAALFAASRAFFSQPIETKDRLAMHRVGRNRGYVGLGVERLDTTALPDRKEAFNISPAEPGQDAWPDLPGWRALMTRYFETCLDLGAALHRGFARDLGVAEDFFADKFRNPMATLRLLRYPAPSDTATDAPGAGAHTDYGNVTILAVNGVSGLQVRPRGGEWTDAPLIPGTFICNIGDCLMRWSNDVYVSTPHRVLRPAAERYAIAFFLDPDADAVVEPIVSLAGDTPHYPPVTGHDYLQERLQATYGHRS